MKKIILSLVIIVLSIITWLHWGGLSSGMGSMLVVSSGFILLDAVNEKINEKSDESVKESK